MTRCSDPRAFFEHLHEHIRSERVRQAVVVQSEVLRAAGDFLRERGFVEILPVIVSPVTDPLRHATGWAEITYYGYRLQLTRSMIFHKQIALLSHERIFTFSPNIRLEPVELADTGRHLVEFTQLDLEVKEASREEVIELGEELLIYILSWVREHCAEQLRFFRRDLAIPDRPFPRIAYADAYTRYGPNFEVILSHQHRQPVWIIDMALEAREFYDREDPSRPGTLVDMDLLYPEGFGEALSGGEREHTYDRVVRRMQQAGIEPAAYELYLDFVQRGLPPSAGFGIGIERLTRYICGLRRIEDGVLFPKVPGQSGL